MNSKKTLKLCEEKDVNKLFYRKHHLAGKRRSKILLPYLRNFSPIKIYQISIVSVYCHPLFITLPLGMLTLYSGY